MVLVKKSTAIGVNALDLTVFRSFSNTVLSMPLIFKFKKHPIKDIHPGQGCTLMSRCLVGTFGFFVLVLESNWLPVFVAQTINNTMPFYSALFGFLINGEKINKQMIICMFGCFGGVIILNIYRPDKENTQEFKYFKYGMISAFCFVTCAAMVQVLNRKMKETHFSVI